MNGRQQQETGLFVGQLSGQDTANDKKQKTLLNNKRERMKFKFIQ